MATLKQIKGSAIQFLDEDPVQYVGSWSSGGSVNTARRYGAGIGSSTAGLIFGGSSPSPVVANTEQYNGTAWTEVNDLNAAQNAQASAGTLTSGMSALGAQSPGANVEDWNGSTWSANPHSLNSARQFPGGDGASNDSAIMVGGEPSPNGALTEIYNGSSWTESGDLNTARNQLAAAGTVTALIAMGGNTGADAETFNGSTWTAVTDMNSGSGGISGSGTSTLALAFAGDPDVANTESWNGSAWTEVNDLSTGREFGASSNITGNTTAFLASGHTTTLVSNTEEWAFPPPTASIVQEGQMWFNSSSSTLKGYGTAAGIPAGTWASGGNLNTARGRAGFASYASSTTHVAMTFGGNVGPGSPGKTVNTEQYNGTSWTEVNNINTVRAGYGGAGTLTSAIYIGGEIHVSPSNTADVELWDGSSWTETTNLNTALRNNVGIGATNTDAMSASGYTTTAVATTEKWDGTSWTELADQNAAKYTRGGAGTTTAAILYAGQAPTTNTETWDGTSWTEVSELNTAGEYRAPSGNSSSQVLAVGKYPLGANVEAWNGTSWSEINDISTARWEGSGTGSSSFGLISGGHPGSPNSYPTATEEFTATAAVTTITTS